MRRDPAGGAFCAVAAQGGWLAAMAASLLACASRQPAPSKAEPEKREPAAAPVVQAQQTAVPDAGVATASAPEAMSNEEGAIAEGELCLSCHSAELIQATRIGAAGWTAEMTKMRNWGALVEERTSGPLAAWFAQRYPAAEPAPAPAMISASEAVAAVAPQREKRPLRGDRPAGAALYAKSCASCHGAAAEGLGGGPVLIEAPALYQRTRFAALVRKGKGRMPASEGMGDAEINNLLVFLRTLH